MLPSEPTQIKSRVVEFYDQVNQPVLDGNDAPKPLDFGRLTFAQTMDHAAARTRWVEPDLLALPR